MTDVSKTLGKMSAFLFFLPKKENFSILLPGIWHLLSLHLVMECAILLDLEAENNFF